MYSIDIKTQGLKKTKDKKLRYKSNVNLKKTASESTKLKKK